MTVFRVFPLPKPVETEQVGNDRSMHAIKQTGLSQTQARHQVDLGCPGVRVLGSALHHGPAIRAKQLVEDIGARRHRHPPDVLVLRDAELVAVAHAHVSQRANVVPLKSGKVVGILVL